MFKCQALNQVYFNPELVLRRGICTKRKIDFFSKKDIIIGKRIIKDMKLHNVGQSIVVSNGIIIAVEDQNGTDSMLDRANKILKKVEFFHPFYDTKTINAQKYLPDLQGVKNSWYCGSYFGYGFHEDGLKSAIDVANKL